jgi:hypothetical protein
MACTGTGNKHDWRSVELECYECPECGFAKQKCDKCPETRRLVDDVAYQEKQDIIAAKDGAYAERNKLVALISKLFSASLERHPENEEWEDDWRWIVFIDLPTGQVSWHIHDSELNMFDHLPRNAGRKWDGHTTDEKYERVRKMLVGRDG